MVTKTVRATVQVALFCECGMSMEHHVQFVRCPNRACPRFGQKWTAPRFDLEEYVEPEEPAEPVGDVAPGV